MDVLNPYVGCIILTEPFEKKTDSTTDNWPSNAVIGKQWILKKVGRGFFRKYERLQGISVSNQMIVNGIKEQYHFLAKHRIGSSSDFGN